VFHVEVRQFPHVARAFNLSRQQLEQRILAPWWCGMELVLDRQRFTPARARLLVYEGPPLDSAEMGLGRGWANATRAGRDVTAQVLEHARGQAPAPAGDSALAQVKQALLERCDGGPVAVHDVVALAGQARLGALVSERVALAEQAVWELLHEGRVALVTAGEQSGQAGTEAWRATLTAWETWAARDVSIEGSSPGRNPNQ